MAIVTDWLGFRAALVAAVEAAMPPGVLETTGVAWADGARPHARHRVLLSVVSAVFDDRDSALSEGGAQVLETMAVITVQITSESTFDTGDADALWLIEQLRLGLRKVSVKEALDLAGIAIQAFPRTTRNVGGFADGRALSIHAIELTLCTTFGLTPDEDAGLVEHVTVEGELAHGSDLLDIEVVVDDPFPEPP